MAYIREASSPAGAESCLFCLLAQAGPPSVETLVLETYRYGFLVLNAFPYTSGHVMVAPYRHADDLLLESADARAELTAAQERVRRALALEYRPDGFNLGVNLGRAAGAGIVGHLHWHVVPRWQGDTNFVPALTGTRVLPESLPDTYARLAGALERTPEDGVSIVARGRA
jgi:ATP adenylyltransferase